MYIDWTYIVLVLPAVLFAAWANQHVNSTYRKYQRQYSRRGITGAQAARYVLDVNGLSNIRIEHISGNLTDHFDPLTNTVRLSDGVYNNTSTAALGIACHEVGHALQHATGYAPIRLRTAIVPITNFGSRLATPLLLVGLILGSFSYTFTYIAYAGVLCFALSTFFQLVTLPTEFNASKRAIRAIEVNHFLDGEELVGTRKVLTAAALTYVAALAVSLTQLIRFIIILNRRRR